MIIFLKKLNGYLEEKYMLGILYVNKCFHGTSEGIEKKKILPEIHEVNNWIIYYLNIE